MQMYRIGEVTDPHDYLLSRGDKLVGCLIRGTYDEDNLLCIATNDVAPYFDDDDSRGYSELLVYNPGYGEIYTSIDDNAERIESSLAYLRNEVGLNTFELNELFGHDGP